MNFRRRTLRAQQLINFLYLAKMLRNSSSLKMCLARSLQAITPSADVDTHCVETAVPSASTIMRARLILDAAYAKVIADRLGHFLSSQEDFAVYAMTDMHLAAEGRSGV